MGTVVRSSGGGRKRNLPSGQKSKLETLVIAEVTYSQDNNGTLTEIRVGPADAYLPEPFRPKAKKTVSEEADF